jgi:hypothetical protein
MGQKPGKNQRKRAERKAKAAAIAAAANASVIEPTPPTSTSPPTFNQACIDISDHDHSYEVGIALELFRNDITYFAIHKAIYENNVEYLTSIRSVTIDVNSVIAFCAVFEEIDLPYVPTAELLFQIARIVLLFRNIALTQANWDVSAGLEWFEIELGWTIVVQNIRFWQAQTAHNYRYNCALVDRYGRTYAADNNAMVLAS